MDARDTAGHGRARVGEDDFRDETTAARGADQPLRVCVLGLGGGGFHLEVEYLLDRIALPLEVVLVYAIDSHVDGTWTGRWPVVSAFVVRSPAMRGDVWRHRITSLSVAFWRACWILLSTRPQCIVAVGTAQAVPFGLAGRLLGVPLYYVESITRVQHESLTSRLVDRLGLARWHRVQWASLETQPRKLFRGSLLQ